jgi:hypothetical protein
MVSEEEWPVPIIPLYHDLFAPWVCTETGWNSFQELQTHCGKSCSTLAQNYYILGFQILDARGVQTKFLN